MHPVREPTYTETHGHRTRVAAPAAAALASKATSPSPWPRHVKSLRKAVEHYSRGCLVHGAIAQ
jgi:hypothetical protein